ncbi:MAG: hypothetical protein K6G16_02720 [Lachnospiraceae bacterium]|nr:hypothetical protein [Lachnospiraceae bacterium]
MIRVLQSVSNMSRAGIETMLMNYYRQIDRSMVQFDFLANKPVPGEYDEEIRSLGGRVFVSPGLNPVHYPAYERFMAKLAKESPELRIVHGHNEAMAFYALESARRAGIRVRIAHAHNTRILRDYKSCVFSDRVTKEALINPEAFRLALEEDNASWVSQILSLRGGCDRRAGEQAVRAAGYDIEKEARFLQSRYLEMAERR